MEIKPLCAGSAGRADPLLPVLSMGVWGGRGPRAPVVKLRSDGCILHGVRENSFVTSDRAVASFSIVGTTQVDSCARGCPRPLCYFLLHLLGGRQGLPAVSRTCRVVREEPRPRLCWVHRGKEEPQVGIWKWMPLKLPLPAAGWHAPPIPSVSLSVRRRAGPKPCPSCLPPPPRDQGEPRPAVSLPAPPPAP